MSLLDDVISAIERERAAHAHAALAMPGGHESFDYGKACGIYAGMQAALDIIEKVLEERASEDRAK